MTARVAEVVYTLTAVPHRAVRRVPHRGQARRALGGEGVALGEAQRHADWRSFEPAIFVESPGVGAIVSSPFVLIGTRERLRGLVPGAPRRLVEQAHRQRDGAGQPRRARPRARSPRRSPSPPRPSAGRSPCYDLDMEDGSKLDEVRIPVTFATDGPGDRPRARSAALIERRLRPAQRHHVPDDHQPRGDEPPTTAAQVSLNSIRSRRTRKGDRRGEERGAATISC